MENIVKKFDEFISEGLWAKGVKRSQTGKRRGEDITEFDKYIKEIEWIDMGHPDVLYAMLDYPLIKKIDNEDVMLSIDDIKDIINNLPEDVSIMNRKQIEYLKKNTEISTDTKYEKKGDDHPNKIICKNEHGEILFNLYDPYSFMFSQTTYFLKFDNKYKKYEYEHVQKATMGALEKPTLLGRTTTGTEFRPDKKHYLIKLVKQK